ncbi:hypothetical protein DNTS_029703 [Danionella cerebrum]|uniref:Uncharacterized protein n=1 Tax=Danionella cerebrum TaxID=2873325 RepID=A0A553QUI4_9TELE|nr:hypothetical protein DNTS_029703 [Danionella translucida]
MVEFQCSAQILADTLPLQAAHFRDAEMGGGEKPPVGFKLLLFGDFDAWLIRPDAGIGVKTRCKPGDGEKTEVRRFS